MVRTSVNILPEPALMDPSAEGIQFEGIEALAACHVEGNGLVVLGPGDGGYQIVGRGQLGFVGVCWGLLGYGR